MSPFISEQFNEILPLASAWAEQHESHILRSGIALSPSQLSDAREMGVACPERVRLAIVPSIPTPDHPVLQEAGRLTGMISPFTIGLALRYGIYLRNDVSNDRFLLAHELVHTAQYERLGCIESFLRQYLHECLTIGYPESPMEQEAVLTSERLRSLS